MHVFQCLVLSGDEHLLRWLRQVSRHEQWSSKFIKTPAHASVPCQQTPTRGELSAGFADKS